MLFMVKSALGCCDLVLEGHDSTPIAAKVR